MFRATIGHALGGDSAVLRAAIGHALGGDSVPCGGSPGGDFAQKTGIGAHRKRPVSSVDQVFQARHTRLWLRFCVIQGSGIKQGARIDVAHSKDRPLKTLLKWPTIACILG